MNNGNFFVLVPGCCPFLIKLVKEEAVTKLLIDAGYQNLAFKLKDIECIVNNVVKLLVIGKCR
jgi:hypothetical protein